MYNEKVTAIFKNPPNVGKMENATAIGEAGNASCGDIMKIYLKIENDKIVDASFQTFGCAAAITTSSVACDMVKGKTIQEALKIKNTSVVEALDGLPPHKVHCSVLAEEAIKNAIENYIKEKKS